MKKIILAGGSGFLGEVLIQQLDDICDAFIVLSRGASKTEGKIKYVHWDGCNPGTWQQELESAEAIINLSGKNVNCRYTQKNKEQIFSSRENSTYILGKTIEQLKHPPAVWINCASATIYRHSETEAMTEEKAEYGEGFSVEVCKRWEKSFYAFNFAHTRMVCLRIGMVLGNGGGVFPVLKRLTKLGLGGRMGSGKQMVSWMDEDDFAGMVRWAILTKEVTGTYNCSSPFPITNKEFSNALKQKLNAIMGLPTPEWLLHIGAFFIRTEPELVLKSRYVIPHKATAQGFVFNYPHFHQCLQHLIPIILIK